VPVERILRELPNPVREMDDAAGESPAEHYWREERIRRGDTLGSVLARLGVDDPEALAFVRLDPSAAAALRLRPGKALRVETDADGRLVSLRFVANNGTCFRSAATVTGSQPAPRRHRSKCGWKSPPARSVLRCSPPPTPSRCPTR